MHACAYGVDVLESEWPAIIYIYIYRMTEFTSSNETNSFAIYTTNDSYICQGAYNGKMYLGQPLKVGLVAVMAVTMVLNFLTNSAVIYALVAVKQLANMSMRLILFLSISDWCLGVFGIPLFIVLLSTFSDNRECNFDSAVEFFVILFAHISAYIIGLIGYDRYFRMKYLNRYSEVIKDWKVYVALLITMFLSFAHALIQIIGIHHNFYKQITMVGIVIDLALVAFMLLPYALTVRVVKKHRQHAHNRHLLSKVDHIITSTAYRIVVAIIILYIPYITFTIIRGYLPVHSPLRRKQWFQFGLFTSYGLALANSFVNAIIFISINTKCRRKIFVLCRNVGRPIRSDHFIQARIIVKHNSDEVEMNYLSDK